MKRTLSILLSLLMILSVFAIVPLTSEAAIFMVPVAVGGEWVTSENCDDILGDGRVSYDFGTDTLYLNEPTIKGDPDNSTTAIAKIYVENRDITIKGSYNMEAFGTQHGLCVLNARVTLNGDFTFLGKDCGVYSTGESIFMEAGKLIAVGKTKQGLYCDGVFVARGSIASMYFESYAQEAIFANGGLDIDSKLKLVSPAGGSVKSKSVYKADGTTKADMAEFAPSTTPSSKIINTVEVTVDTPKAGGVFSYKASVPAGKGYYVAVKNDTPYKNGVAWMKVDGYDMLNPSSVAVYGQKYRVYFEVQCLSGYEFAPKAQLKVICNGVTGKTESVSGQGSNMMLGSADFTCTEKAEVTVILGDADGDGSVTIFDATAIQRYLAEMPTEKFVEAAADADGDGSVTIFDATAIQRYLAEMSANPNIGKPIA